MIHVFFIRSQLFQNSHIHSRCSTCEWTIVTKNLVGDRWVIPQTFTLSPLKWKGGHSRHKRFNGHPFVPSVLRRKKLGQSQVQSGCESEGRSFPTLDDSYSIKCGLYLFIHFCLLEFNCWKIRRTKRHVCGSGWGNLANICWGFRACSDALSVLETNTMAIDISKAKFVYLSFCCLEVWAFAW